MNTHGPLLPFVLLAGFLDSLNPCAIAVLLIFLALMFTLRKSRRVIFILGISYIIAVYLTYLAIGVGLLKVVVLFGTPHLIAKIAAWIVIVLGIWGLKEYFLPDKFNFLTIPISLRQIIGKWAMKATLPASLVAGILVGIFEFPCSGAIYVATITLLNTRATFFKGLSYLLLYNFMFILPLLIIFALVINRFVAEKLINLDEKYASLMRLFTASIMIIVGAIILIWFV
jgi:cytochrome c biogenesis protein CcdA